MKTPADIPIAPLHVWSGYSLGRGPVRLGQLIDRAVRLGHARLALTDVNNLYAATSFARRAAEAGVQPIHGAELRGPGLAATALVDSPAGWSHLCQLITQLQHDHPATPAELQDGLLWIAPRADAAEDLLAAGIEPGRLWLGVDPASQSRPQRRRLADLARSSGLRTVATGTAALLADDDLETARLLGAIRLGCSLADVPPTERPPAGATLRGAATLAAALADWPGAAAANLALAQRCADFHLLPRQPVFPRFACPGGLDERAYLRRLVDRGLRRRYGLFPPPSAEARADRELRLIEKLGFSGYFLVVWDIVRYARRRGVPVAGRGSGASSLVAYCLEITNVCPLTYDLPFERFLHEGREDFPDLDVDFCWRIRDEVIDYAFDRWGQQNVAMVSSHLTYKDASALRETAKACGLSNAQISRLTRAGQRREHLREALAVPGERIVQLAGRIEGLPQHLSVHPGGIVIGRAPIDRYVPTQPAAKGVTITQMDKDGIEEIRLVKIDILGNRNLATVRYAVDHVADRTGERIDIESLPPADPATVALLQAGDTVGCNQLESPGMRHLLKMFRPESVADVMKVLALIRPGAASIGMKETFIRRHRGLETPPAGHRHVDAVLADTHGVMLYEDDVMLTAAALMDCDLPTADRFRKAVQKCPDDAGRLQLSREFLALCRRNRVPEAYARDLWVQMAKFNAYSFCRAHAASYALLSYAGAWLKVHHPREFWLAAINNNQSMYHPRVYVEQAKRAGVPFALPDVNRSGAEAVLDDGAIRMGLGRVDGLGPVSVEKILDARSRRPFDSVTDCADRTGLGASDMRPLVLCGAFDALGPNRPTMMAELNLATGPGGNGSAGRRDPARHDPPLLTAQPTLPAHTADFPPLQKILQPRSLLGVSTGPHLLSFYRHALARHTDATSADLPDRLGRRVRIAGLLEARRATPTDSGKSMMFLTLDDEQGLFEVTCFPDVLARLDEDFASYGPYLVTGTVDSQYDSLAVTATDVRRVHAQPAWPPMPAGPNRRDPQALLQPS